MTNPYPLTWPDTMPRKKTREKSRFKTTLSGAINNVKNSLKLFGQDSGKALRDVVISSNVSLGNSKPSDPGVAVWFLWDDMPICIPVDRYLTVEDNLQAIHHVIEARRVELRHGTLALVRATMQGFIALPSPAKRTWRAVLGFDVGPPVSEADVNEAYRLLAKQYHPDSPGGSVEKMSELNIARDEALKEMRNG